MSTCEIRECPRRLALRWIAVLSFVFTLSTGCSAIQKALGLKKDLKDEAVTRIDLSMAGGLTLCPGTQTNLIVTTTLEDGSTLTSEGAGDGNVGWENFLVEVQGGTVENGLFVLSEDPYQFLNEKASVTVEAIGHAGKRSSLDLDVGYDCSFHANFSGERGFDGQQGQTGSSGNHGKDEQTSPSYAKPGGHGQRGGSGGNGGNGADGMDAPSVFVNVTNVVHPIDGSPLLEVMVSGGNVKRSWIIDAEAGSLIVSANGGDGGNGGMGGGGGSGGSGGSGVPPGNGGDGGDGGSGGSGGNGGNGGTIQLTFDVGAGQYADRITLETFAGRAGGHGTAGFGGSGGNTNSGGTQGHGGQKGQDGQQGMPGQQGSTSQ